MGLLRCQIDRFWTDDLPRDHIVNVVFFRDDGDSDGPLESLGFLPSVAPDYNATAQDWATQLDAYWTAHAPPFVDGGATQVRLYDMHAAKPRPVLGEYTVPATQARAPSGMGNRDVALCLSFFGTRNLPRQRGRIFLGPILGTHAGSLTPSSSDTSAILALAPVFHGFQVNVPDPGTNTDVDWVVHSVAGNASWKVTNGWCDNEWDTQRRRGLKADTRNATTMSS